MKAVVFTLGCKVNSSESASLVHGLEERGYTVYDELVYADIYILNTCAVTGEAEKKSRQAIARVRAINPDAKIFVCGCASQHNPQSFMDKNVDLILGANHKSKILEYVDRMQAELIDVEQAIFDTVTGMEESNTFEELPTTKYFQKRAYIKVQDGCNKFCTYCIIPYLRGRTRSRTIASIQQEIANSNALEFVITGIDLSSFDDNGKDLADLMQALANCKGRIRLSSLEVGVITDKLLATLKSMPNFAPHFHLSLQSGSNNVLKKMNRKYTREEFIQAVQKIHTIFPNVAITTDIIVGFPNETEQDFLETMSIVKICNFSQIHAFPYSKREGTVAAKWIDLDSKIKKERLHRLLQLAKEQQQEYERQFINENLQFIPEEVQGEYTVGYSENYIRLYYKGECKEPCLVQAVKPYEQGLLVKEM